MPKDYLLKKVINVLILDAEEKGLEIIKDYFSLNHINIIIAKTPTEARNKFKKNNIDCFIVDPSTQKSHGFECIQKLRKDQKLRYIPLIILTSRGFINDRIEGYKIGCNAYVSKPFDPNELQYTIRNVVYQKNFLKQKLISSYFLIKRLRYKLIEKYKECFKENLNLKLTSKEELILSYLLKDKNTIKIKKKLKVQTRTIEKSISKLLDKTQTKNNRELKILPWNLI